MQNPMQKPTDKRLQTPLQWPPYFKPLSALICCALWLGTTNTPLWAAPSAPQAQKLRLKRRQGKASYYGPRFHGRCCTANGERVNMYALTAAHPHLPFGTRVRVTNLKNGKKVIVRINDRGPFHSNRIIDLSLGAFEKIAHRRQGIIRVRLSLLNESLSDRLKTPLPSMRWPEITP